MNGDEMVEKARAAFEVTGSPESWSVIFNGTCVEDVPSYNDGWETMALWTPLIASFARSAVRDAVREIADELETVGQGYTASALRKKFEVEGRGGES